MINKLLNEYINIFSIELEIKQSATKQAVFKDSLFEHCGRNYMLFSGYYLCQTSSDRWRQNLPKGCKNRLPCIMLVGITA